MSTPEANTGGIERGAGRGWASLAVPAAATVVTAGVVLRFATGSPLWLDEALSLHIANGDLSLPDALRRDGHPGLYYLLLGWWTDLFGDGDTTARALSGLFGVATLGALWGATRRHGVRIATATLLLAASSPYLIRYATEVRMYALLALIITLGWWALDSAWARPSLARLAAVAATTAAAMHTHYWSFYAVAAAALIVAVAARHVDDLRRAAAPLVAMAVGVATFVPWLPVFFDQLADTGTPWADRARPTEIFVETLQGIGGNNRFEGETLGILLAFAATLGLLAVGPARDRVLQVRSSVAESVRIPAAAAGIALGLGAVAAIVTAGAFEARYAAIAIPFILLLAGRGVAMLEGRAGAAVLALLVAFGLVVSIDEARRTRSQGEQAADAIDRGADAGDMVVFCPDQVGPATWHYLDTEVEGRAFPSGDGFTIDWRDYLDRASQLDARAFARDAHEAAGDHTIWFVSGRGYRGLDGQCAALNAELHSVRAAEQVVGLEEVFEGMFTIRFEAR